MWFFFPKSLAPPLGELASQRHPADSAKCFRILSSECCYSNSPWELYQRAPQGKLLGAPPHTVFTAKAGWGFRKKQAHHLAVIQISLQNKSPEYQHSARQSVHLATELNKSC